jgi:hypothetical protein
LTFGLGIIILQGVSRRKSLAGANIMYPKNQGTFSTITYLQDFWVFVYLKGKKNHV